MPIKTYGQQQKGDQAKEGAPDIIIAGHPMFLCEMKSKSKSSRIAKEQTEFLERADKKGCFCCVAYGWESAMQAVEDWLSTQ